MKAFFVIVVSLLVVFPNGICQGKSMGDAYQEDDSGILKWSPTWLSSNPERYAESTFSRRPTYHTDFYYNSLRDETEPRLYKLSPSYLTTMWSNWKRWKTIPVAWEGGDSYPSVGSPEWFRNNELLN